MAQTAFFVGGCVAYQHADFDGNRQDLGANLIFNHVGDRLNDSISSFRFYQGCRIIAGNTEPEAELRRRSANANASATNGAIRFLPGSAAVTVSSISAGEGQRSVPVRHRILVRLYFALAGFGDKLAGFRFQLFIGVIYWVSTR